MSRLQASAIVVLVLLGPTAVVRAAVEAEPRCFNAKQVAADLLSRPIGAVHLNGVAMAAAVETLRSKHGVPLSFLEGGADARLTVNVDRGTVEDVLRALVAQAKDYRFDLVRDHLLLYANDPRYRLTLEPDTVNNLQRYEGGNRAGRQIRKLKPFATMDLPTISGDIRHPLYSDTVSWAGAATVIERLGQVAGDDPSVVFSIQRDRDGGDLVMTTGFVAQISAIEVTAAKKELSPADTVQVHVIGTGPGGLRWDVSPAGCGAQYHTLTPNLVTVDKDGLVTALKGGQAIISVQVQGLVRPLAFSVRPMNDGKEK
jgi:hypothetical protein